MPEVLPLFLKPHAKINLGLFIKGKRPDGYHLLETVLFPIRELNDQMWLQPIEGSGVCILELTGIELDGNPEDNLCVKAYRELEKRVGTLPSVHIKLSKGIPAGAGLGGGSSDAAASLNGLNQLFDLGLSPDELASIAARLGADVPFFIYDKALLASGTGTELTEISLKMPYRIELITPPIHSSTVAAYKSLDYRLCDPDRDLETVLKQPVSTWKTDLQNDLEIPVFAQYPELAKIKQNLYDQGAVYAAMSGSGSAVFGLFEEEEER